jgi:hypothetical protein
MNTNETMPTAPVHAVVMRTERGWAGHFICAHRCRFRRNTLLVRGDVRVVVSSVGLMERQDGNGFDEIGSRRHFETMVFHAKYDGRYWDADVSREIFLDGRQTISEQDAEDVANDMHEAAVKEVAAKMAAGTIA